jgi:hypothetical protein
VEPHQALAELRQRQDRWEESLPHWRHVIRVRSKEPTGYEGLARASIRLERWDAARSAVDALLSRDWPQRFGDVAATGRELARAIPGPR